MKVLVLGIGNTLLSDEGIGVHVIQALHGRFTQEEQVELMDGGTLSFTLAEPIAETDALIVVDATLLESIPGTLRVFEGALMDRFLTHNRKSTVHEVGLADLMTIAKLTGCWPTRRALVAIQPKEMTWGEYPTREVALAIPKACQCVHTIIEGWRLDSSKPIRALSHAGMGSNAV